MKKISRKLLTSGLSLAFATVALGTTTFAWFTTNAQVTADITVGVQATGDSILISTDCFDWGSSVQIDASDLELNPVTYVAADGELSATADSFTDLDGAAVSGGTSTAANYLEFVLYLKVSSASKVITFDPAATTDTAEITNTTALSNYTILKTTDFNYSASFSKTSTAASTLTAGNKVKVDAVNALRSVVDVSAAGSAANASYLELENNQGAVAAAFGSSTLTYTRKDTIVGYEGQGQQPTSYTSGQVYNFGNSLAGNNAANSYIETVLGTNFSDSTATPYYVANGNYAGHALSETWSSTLTTTDNALFTTNAANQIYALRFSYWLEGYDADCFDAIMGQALSIHFGFRALEAE